MRSAIERPSAQIIPFPTRSKVAVSPFADAIVSRRSERTTDIVCSAAFDSWYHAAAIAEADGQLKS